MNPSRTPRSVVVALSAKHPAVGAASDLWQQQKVVAMGRTLQVTVEDRNAAVIRLE